MYTPRPAAAFKHDRGPKRGTSGLGTKGPRSLADMAVHVLAYNISAVEDEHLDCVPEKYLRQTWARLQKTGATLHSWKLLSKYVLKDGAAKSMNLYHHKEHICQPTLPLASYTSLLSSPAYNFIASLTISGPCHFTVSEMLGLASLPNLGVMEIIAPSAPANPCDPPPAFPQVSNSLFISWADQKDPFPALRVLRIWGPGLLTQNVLRHLDKFPSLALFDVLGYRGDWADAKRVAAEHGWKMSSPMSRYWDPLLRYLHLIMPADLISQPESPGSLQFRAKADFVDNELMRYVERAENPIARAPARPRKLLPDVLEYRRERRQGLFNHRRPPDGIRKGGCNNTRGCSGPVSSDVWNYWTCSFIGQLRDDRDWQEAICKHGIRRGPRTLDKHDASYKSLSEEITQVQAMFENIVMTGLPFAHLQLGHYARTREGIHPIWVGEEDSQRYTFARRDICQFGTRPCDPRSHQATAYTIAERPRANGSRKKEDNKRIAPVDEEGRYCKKIKIQDILNAMSG